MQTSALTPEALTVYLAVLGLPPESGYSVSAAALAEKAGVPEGRLPALWTELVVVGLVHARKSSGDGYFAMNPMDGVATLLAEVEHAAGRQRALLEAAGTAMGRHRGPSEKCMPLTGDELRRRVAQLATQTRTEWLSIESGADPLVGADAEWPAHVRVRRLLAHGTAQSAPVPTTGSGRHASNPADERNEIRPRHGNAPTLVVMDHAVVLAGDEAGCWELSGLGVVQSTVSLFDQLWDAAPRPARPPAHLTDGEREVLQLMALGHTDEVIARQLGCSLRTVRRITAALMQQLGARSRFQAGVYACQRGWLANPAQVSWTRRGA